MLKLGWAMPHSDFCLAEHCHTHEFLIWQKIKTSWGWTGPTQLQLELGFTLNNVCCIILMITNYHYISLSTISLWTWLLPLTCILACLIASFHCRKPRIDTTAHFSVQLSKNSFPSWTLPSSLHWLLLLVIIANWTIYKLLIEQYTNCWLNIIVLYMKSIVVVEKLPDLYKVK